MYKNDQRIVITLDAGGTNFVFSAMRGYDYIIDPITYPSHSDNLDQCLDTMVKGFEEVISKIDESPVAISFAFPGPADYRAGTADERGEGPERRDSEPRQTACKGMLANIRSGATVGGVLRYNQEGMQLVGRTAIFRRVTTDTRADSLSGRAAGFAGRTGFPT